MLGFIILELSVLAGLWIAFIVMMSFRKVDGTVRVLRWWKSPYSSQLVGIALLGIIESAALIGLGTDHMPPLWVFAMIFGAIDIVTARWLYLMWKARKTPPSDSD